MQRISTDKILKREWLIKGGINLEQHRKPKNVNKTVLSQDFITNKAIDGILRDILITRKLKRQN